MQYINKNSIKIFVKLLIKLYLQVEYNYLLLESVIEINYREVNYSKY